LAKSTEQQIAALKEEKKKLKGDVGKKAIDAKIAKLDKDLTGTFPAHTLRFPQLIFRHHVSQNSTSIKRHHH
jgi:hypothetical protein